MISCCLMGGLGNQLFEIATAHALALRHNDQSGFNLYACHTPQQGNKAIKYSDTLYKNLNRIEQLNFKNVYSEKKFSFDEISYSSDLLLLGYFQSYKYFFDFKDEIIKLFHFPAEIDQTVMEFLKNLNKENITVIHVRRGDYLNHPDFHIELPKEYFIKGMSSLTNTHYIFISDDIEWVKDNFKGENISYSQFNDELLDLRLMTLSNNLIISNSSFSWWGAFLNQNSNKVVIAPKNWFGPKGPQDTQDIIPNNWFIL